MKILKTLTPWIASFLAMMLVVGGKVLDPTNISWLVAKTDRFQHYIGWRLFYNSPAVWPLGKSTHNGIELANSVVYSDSIPFAAIAFKYLLPGFSAHGHYFGFWILACFLLQGVFAWHLIGLVSRDYGLRLGGTVLFLFMPTFMDRIGLHMALGGQFVLLAALYLSLRETPSRKGLWWIALLAFTTFLHAYLLAMVMGLWIADVLSRRGTAAAGNRLELELLAGCAVIALSVWQAGYLTVAKGINEPGFGVHNMNLLAPLDAGGWSYFLPDLPGRADESESFNYLGAGTLLLLLAGIGLAFGGRLHVPTGWRRLVPMLVVLGGCLLFAISNTVVLGTHSTHIPIPDWATAIANMFRSSGRMAWPVFYFVLLAGLWAASRGLPRRVAGPLVCLAANVKVADTSAGWILQRQSYAQPASPVWRSGLESPFWAAAATRYTKVRYLLPWNETPHWQQLTYFSAQHHMATDAVYLARIDVDAIRTARVRGRRVAEAGQFEADTLYVIDANAFAAVQNSYNQARDSFGIVDGLVVLAPGWQQCRGCPEPAPVPAAPRPLREPAD